jgi:hypothetical protein
VYAVPPNLIVAPTFLSFQGTAGSADPVELPLLVVNRGGGGPLNFTTTVTSDSPWLTLRGAGKTDSVLNAAVDFPRLSPGVYAGGLDLTSGPGAPKHVDVNVLARPSGPALSVSQTGLLFNLGAAAGTSDSDVVSIGNQGDGSMPWTADVLIGSEFLSASPASGATPAGGSSKLTIAPQTAAKPNASDLIAGNYYGLVRVSSPGAANSPQYILTVLRVAGGGQTPTVRPGGLILQTAGLVATGRLRDRDPLSLRQTVRLYDTAEQAVRYQLKAVFLAIPRCRAVLDNSREEASYRRAVCVHWCTQNLTIL